MKYNTLREATEHWVRDFNAIPAGFIEKLLKANGIEAVREITPPALGDRVYLMDDEHDGQYGKIISTNYDNEDDLYEIRIEGQKRDDAIVLSADEFEVRHDDFLPIWGTMWAFDDFCDNDWLEEHLQEMANCGFRIYEQEDFDYIFGIDGAGYDFYEDHWIPLYKARGLHWHKEEK